MKSFLVGLAILVMGAAAYLLYQDYNKPATSVQAPKTNNPIAVAESPDNSVKRQSADNGPWEQVDPKAPLYPSDLVRTGPASSVVIKVSDGTLIQQSENSLSQIQRLNSGPALDLRIGDIFSQNGSEGIQFSTRGAIIKGEGADIKMNTDTNARSQMTVVKGKAFVLDKNNRRADLNESETADLNDGILVQVRKGTNVTKLASPSLPTPAPAAPLAPAQTTTIKPKVAAKSNLKINLLKPENGENLNLSPEENSVEFNWSTALPAKFYSLALSTTNDFKKIVQSHTVNEMKDIVRDLLPQTYFWKVTAFGTHNIKLATSEIQTLNLKLKLPLLPELVTPAAEITWTDVSPIEFSWKKMDKATKYRITISTDPNQRHELIAKQTDANTFNWTWTEPKSYYWSVRALNSRGGLIGQSEVRHLTITAANKKLPTFIIISPKDQTEVIRDLNIENPQSVSFQWKVTKPLPGPLTLQISTEPEFKEPILFKNVVKNIFPVKLKKEGVYYWSLSSQSEDGSQLEISPVTTFNLKGKASLLAPIPISPLNNSKIEIDEPKAIKFSWKTIKNFPLYHIVIKRIDPKTNEGFIVTDTSLKEKTFTSEPLEEGSYTWNIYSVDDNQKEKGQDQDLHFSLSLHNLMDAPKLKDPVIK